MKYILKLDLLVFVLFLFVTYTFYFKKLIFLFNPSNFVRFTADPSKVEENTCSVISFQSFFKNPKNRESFFALCRLKLIGCFFFQASSIYQKKLLQLLSFGAIFFTTPSSRFPAENGPAPKRLTVGAWCVGEHVLRDWACR